MLIMPSRMFSAKIPIRKKDVTIALVSLLGYYYPGANARRSPVDNFYFTPAIFFRYNKRVASI